MIIESISAWMSFCEGTFRFIPIKFRQYPHIAPVVVAEQQDDVVRDPHSLFIIFLYLLIERPKLRSFIRWLSCGLFNKPSLVVDHPFQQLHIGILAHRLITITPHTDGYDVLGVFHPLYTFFPELVKFLLIGVIVPCSMALIPGPFLMGFRHWFMMARAHHDAHVVSSLHIERVIGIERRIPHGRPHIIPPESEHQFKNPCIKLMVIDASIELIHPSTEARCLIVEENSSVSNSRFPIGEDSIFQEHLILFPNRSIRPIIPRTDSKLFGEFINSINCSSLIGTSNDQFAIREGDEKLFPFSLNLLFVEHLFLKKRLNSF